MMFSMAQKIEDRIFEIKKTKSKETSNSNQ